MARAEPERTFQQSLLDRLFDDDPSTSAERAISRGESLQQLKSALRRDLEWLLNTRRTVELAPESLVEVKASLYHYGLPDISSMSRDSTEVQSKLARRVEEAIASFEPRLTGVKVSISEEGQKLGELHFVIDGMMQLDPTPERVTFDTVLDTAKGLMQVQGSANA